MLFWLPVTGAAAPPAAPAPPLLCLWPAPPFALFPVAGFRAAQHALEASLDTTSFQSHQRGGRRVVARTPRLRIIRTLFPAVEVLVAEQLHVLHQLNKS